MSDRNGTAMHGYYGRPIVKPPEWTDLIPTYFFAGGLAGAAATLAFAERIAKNDLLANRLLIGASAAAAVSGVCLIADLRRPERFLNMLRVFKPTSPMSVGVYVFSLFSGAVLAATASETLDVARPLGRACEAIAALTGPVMSCYTAVLIADTAIPAWLHGRRSMPLLFAATSAACAGALGMLVAPAKHARSARRLAMLGSAAVAAGLDRLHRELGPEQARAYREGEAATFSKAAKALNVAGGALALLARENDALGKAAGAMILLGGLAERFGVYRAGCNSAKDPRYTIAAQRSGAVHTEATIPSAV